MRFPKALMTVKGETFVESILHKASALGVDPVLIITGPDHESIARQISGRVECIKNENYMQGQISSVQKGIEAIGNSGTAVMVWPVDQPLVETETARKILGAYQDHKQVLTIPVYLGQKGHPVIYDRQAMEAALALQPDQTGKDLQRIFSSDTTFVEVDDPGIVIDIDTPEDYEKYVTPLDRGRLPES